MAATWYSKLVTTTTTQFSNLQSKWLQGEADGDTEDDTHVCRVLRSYYTETGRRFPTWLPPDPKAPPPIAPVYAQQSQVGSRYGGLNNTPGSGGAPQPTGLSSLWDNPGAGGNQPQGNTSLRQGRGTPQAAGRPSPFARPNDGGRNSDVQARPLPSQRAGSYQQGGYEGGATSGGVSAQDRLKQRLRGGAKPSSPAPSGGGYNLSGSGGRGGGGMSSSGDYEDRFAPGGMYDGGGSGGGSGGRRGDGRPFLAANAPWASNEDEFAGGSGRTGPSSRRGLPSGPRMR